MVVTVGLVWASLMLVSWGGTTPTPDAVMTTAKVESR